MPPPIADTQAYGSEDSRHEQKNADLIKRSKPVLAGVIVEGMTERRRTVKGYETDALNTATGKHKLACEGLTQQVNRSNQAQAKTNPVGELI